MNDSNVTPLAHPPVYSFKGSLVRTHTHLFNIIPTITIPGTTETFVAREKFTTSAMRLSPDFIMRFTSGNGKLEKLMDKRVLFSVRLRLLSTSNSYIFNQLGGVRNCEVSLAEIHHLLDDTVKKEGDLRLSNHCPNLFYALDQHGEYTSVVVNRNGVHWDITAEPISDFTTLSWGRNTVLFLPESALARLW